MLCTLWARRLFFSTFSNPASSVVPHAESACLPQVLPSLYKSSLLHKFQACRVLQLHKDPRARTDSMARVRTAGLCKVAFWG